MDRSSKIALLVVCLFALPFAGFGLFAFVSAVGRLWHGPVNGQTLVLLLFSLVFSGIGFGLIVATFYGSRLNGREQRKQAEHPAEPWLWRDDWAQGRVVSKTRADMIGAWVFAVLWNLVSAPVLVFVPQEAARKPLAYLAFLFPVAGVFLLVRAIRQTLAYREFGRTVFELASVPGVIGGELKGVIQTRFRQAPENGVRVRLTCVHRVTTGSGDNQSTRDSIVWRRETALASTQLYAGPSGTTIPVSFRIPWDAQPCEKRSSRDQTLWLLEAQAEVPGVDYHDIFEVPVFRTQQTPAHPQPGDNDDVAAVPARPANLTIAITSTAQGTEFYFPPARNKSFAAWTTVFLFIFGSATIFLASHAPFIFPIAFGAFTLLLLYITVQMWLGTTRVGVSGSEVLVQDGYLGSGTVRRFPFTELASISSRIASQQGDGTGTAYYDIELHLRSGKKVTLGRTIRNQQEVEWLMDEMRRLTGLRKAAAAAAGT